MTEIHAVQLRGCRQHNLCGFDIELPLRRLVVVTGPAGSGKSSLLFETVHAESRRRFLESVSVSARRQLESVGRPRMDAAEGLPLTVAVRANSLSRGLRSTVGTESGLLALWQSAFARWSRPICPDCNAPVAAHTPADVAREVSQLPEGTRVLLGFDIAPDSDRAGTVRWLQRAGFSRLLVDGRIVKLAEFDPGSRTDTESAWSVLADRIRVGQTAETRIRESLELCFRGGHGSCVVFTEGATDSPSATTVDIDGAPWTRRAFAEQLQCGRCGRRFPEPSANLFNFNSPLGSCPACHGRGVTRSSRRSETEICAACDGTRLNNDARAFQLGGQTLPDVARMTVDKLAAQFRDWLPEDAQSSGTTLISQIERRHSQFERLSLGYLTLDIPVAELSGAEVRRLALLHAAAAPLTGALYLVDEPSAGLLDEELSGVYDVLDELIAAGAGVMAVDHHPALRDRADWIVRLGPGAGPDGGEIIFQGTPADDREAFPPPVAATSDRPPRTRGTRKTVRIEPLDWPATQDRELQVPTSGLTIFCGPSATRPVACFRQRIVPQLTAAAEAGHLDLDVIHVERRDSVRQTRRLVVSAIKGFAEIRTLFAQTADARKRNFSPGFFSLHTADGGRCERCRGTGQVVLDLQFLPDVEMVCTECGGRRYRKDALDVRFRGLNPAEVLDLTAGEAFRFFKGQGGLQRKFQALKELNLAYLTLGQPLTKLAAGERARLALALELSRLANRPRLLLVEEPTTGLADEEVLNLLQVLHRFTEDGNAVLAADTHPLLRAGADHELRLVGVEG